MFADDDYLEYKVLMLQPSSTCHVYINFRGLFKTKLNVGLIFYVYL